jgi:hypothetical protein
MWLKTNHLTFLETNRGSAFRSTSYNIAQEHARMWLKTKEFFSFVSNAKKCFRFNHLQTEAKSEAKNSAMTEEWRVTSDEQEDA